MTRKRTPKWLQAARHAPTGLTPGQKPDWVARVLTRAGAVSPDILEVALRAGRVSVNGKVVRDGMVLVRPEDLVRVDGQPVLFRPPTLVLAFHKPAGVVCSTRDPEGEGTVFERLLPQLPPELARVGWHCVGRLDRQTTGLLLFTNDERFVTHATAPSTHLPKRYVAQVQGESAESKLEPIRAGLQLDDGPTKPAEARFTAPGVVELVIREGRNHQVKRMLGAVGLPVRALHREGVGGLALDLPESGWRLLTGAEIREALGFAPEPA